jgi:hypothetical protein
MGAEPKLQKCFAAPGPPSWIPFFVGEFFKAWMDRRQETNNNNNNQEYSQYATLDDEGTHYFC